MATVETTNGSTGARTDGGPPLERRGDGFLHRTLDVGDVKLHVAEARPEGLEGGVPEGVPLVVLLHGFPEFWWSWRHQLRALARAGIWAVAPDMRGYNESDKPPGIAAYEIERLSGDVAGLNRALGRSRATVVGHDWGGAVAWAFAHQHPAMLERLAVLNCPHPKAFTRSLRTARQLRKSWYMFFFQLPAIPERTLAKDDFAELRRMLASDGMPAEEIEHYVDAARVPGAATASINYYRAAIRRVFKASLPRMEPIAAPVLVVWGDRDRFLGRELAEPPADLVPEARVVHVADATHWVQRDAADAVSRLLVDHVAGRRDAA